MKSIKEMNDFFEALYLMNSKYCWRANCEVMTAKLAEDLYHAEYKSNPNSKYNANYYTKKYEEAKGLLVCDCSGAFYPLSGHDNTAKGYYSECTEKGDMSTFKSNVPCMVFRGTSPTTIHHIGYYLGNGISIEMESSDTNCQRKVFDKSKWNYWGKPNFVDYSSLAQIKAVDISHHNTVTNWDLLLSQIKDIIIRIGYRGSSTGKITFDDKFKTNMAQATDHGMNIGAYFYDQSIDEVEAIEQAQWVVYNLKQYNICYPIYIDSEYANKEHTGRADHISVEQRTKNIIAFCETVKKLGYTPGVYASDSWFKSMINFDSIKGYEIWAARYSINKPNIGKYDGWQYGSEYFKWATAPIDTNYFYKDYRNNTKNMPIQVPSSTPVATTPPTKREWLEQEQELMCIVYNAKSGLKIRTEPLTKNPDGTDRNNTVGALKNGAITNTIAVTSNGWWKVGTNRYISGKYCRPVVGEIYNCNGLNVHSSADKMESSIIKGQALSPGSKFSIKKKIGDMYLISTSDGLVGYISVKFVKVN